jgi:hypothetical protein
MSEPNAEQIINAGKHRRKTVPPEAEVVPGPAVVLVPVHNPFVNASGESHADTGQRVS